MLTNPEYHDDATALRQDEYAEIKKITIYSSILYLLFSRS